MEPMVYTVAYYDYGNEANVRIFSTEKEAEKCYEYYRSRYDCVSMSLCGIYDKWDDR